jgi:hypothetical protein
MRCHTGREEEQIIILEAKTAPLWWSRGEL